ncbi:flavin monoamine oxidase family protein [Alkalimarinus coralli]|uniref:flavin monoamine oxidase family protein n=1 Tax=Alkalimarinus coralli TaxID=2935863 RepID=UPI00202B7EF5|nr:FAD-dependent oxidoreductase [Alkalimarinus coralli]
MKSNRRDFLRLGMGAIASGVLPASFSWSAPNVQRVQVAVVGGGLAGLTTARNLVNNGIDSVVVLESRDRVGGRTLNLPLPGGHVVEGGGEWIGPGQDRIASLAADVGVDTFDAYYDGAGIYEIQGLVSKGLLPELSFKKGYDFTRLAWRLQSMADQLPLGSPWQAANAHYLDHITLADWLKGEGASKWTVEAFRIICRAIMSGYPERISLLWFLHYIQSSGGLLGIALNDNGLQDLRFVGGSQQVSINVAKALGHRVKMGEPVTSISDNATGPVEVRTPKGTYLADQVVVAMAPADTLRINFKTGLTAQRNALVKQWAGLTRLPLIKHSVIYKTPFWREAGLNGNVVTDHAPLQLVFDNSPPDASLGVLTAFLSAAEVPAMASEPDRARLLPQELSRYFGPQSMATMGYVEKDWSTDPWSIGCITPLTKGLLTSAGPALRAPVGRIHWAGTECAEVGCGYMDGAVRSGDRAAIEVLSALTS